MDVTNEDLDRDCREGATNYNDIKTKLDAVNNTGCESDAVDKREKCDLLVKQAEEDYRLIQIENSVIDKFKTFKQLKGKDLVYNFNNSGQETQWIKILKYMAKENYVFEFGDKLNNNNNKLEFSSGKEGGDFKFICKKNNDIIPNIDEFTLENIRERLGQEQYGGVNDISIAVRVVKNPISSGGGSSYKYKYEKYKAKYEQLKKQGY